MNITLTAPAGWTPPRQGHQARPALAKLNQATIHRARNLQTGKREIWAAETADDVWAIQREEDEDTTWTVHHRPTGRHLPGYQSLRKARIAIASGAALRDLEEWWARIERAVAQR